MRPEINLNSKMNVCLFLGSFTIGGTERNVLNIVRRIDRSRFGIEVCSVYRDGLLRSEFERSVGSITCLSNRYRGKNLLAKILLGKIPALVKLSLYLFKRRKCILHSFGFPLSYYVVAIGTLLGANKIIFCIQDWDVWKRARIYRLLDRLVSRLARLIISDGGGARQFAIAAQGFDAKKMITIYDGVNIDELNVRHNMDEVKSSLGLDINYPVVGVIARLDNKKKGQEYFLRAVPLILNEYPHTQFALVGDGPDREWLEHLTDQLGISDRVMFAGANTELADMISILDIVVIPSIWESVPKILLEAMWLEKPVIASRVGDIPEILDDNITGLLVPCRNPQEIKMAVVRLLRDRELSRKMGKEGRRKIERQSLVLDTSIRKLEAIYENVFQGRY